MQHASNKPSFVRPCTGTSSASNTMNTQHRPAPRKKKPEALKATLACGVFFSSKNKTEVSIAWPGVTGQNRTLSPCQINHHNIERLWQNVKLGGIANSHTPFTPVLHYEAVVLRRFVSTAPSTTGDRLSLPPSSKSAPPSPLVLLPGSFPTFPLPPPPTPAPVRGGESGGSR